ncbi:putative carboxylesterase 2 [Morus notabilis]|uniref:Putative carboxylesterase 2 n=1 Tax=Morus notabilis TaxID=981085 RepID=W9RBV7_9ROSA|nr:putative carboxylesterase 2 [Morus notabilis]
MPRRCIHEEKASNLEGRSHGDANPTGQGLTLTDRARDSPLQPKSAQQLAQSPKMLLLPRIQHNRPPLPPHSNDTTFNKLPLVVYFHGGGFCVSSPINPKCHNYLNALVAQAKGLAVSVNNRKAQEHPVPTAFNDSWAALHWIISHHGGNGPEPWLNDHADFGRVFLAGESAGANIAHNLALAAGDPECGLGIGLLGLALAHPYFWGSVPIGSEASNPEKKAFVDPIWPICNNDPMINPVAEGAPSLAGLGCGRVLDCVAEDMLRDRGRLYYDVLSRSGWMGVVEIEETRDEDHVFYLNDLDGQLSKDLIRRLAAFFNRDRPPLI